MREIDRVIHLLARLPGLGPRSARRAALALIREREGLMRPLAQALEEAADAVRPCSICGNLDTRDPCGICTDPKRDRGVICVVEQLGDLWALDRSGAFSGLYHVLGGVLSAIDGVGPEDLAITPLVARCRNGSVREVILATNLTVDGQTTAHYVAERLAGMGVTVTRLAPGVPVGGELDYLDDGTLAAALAARRSAG
jgi:recombination protein RecR